MQKQVLACKRIERTKSYIRRSGVHWRIGGIQSYGATFCGSIDNAKECKGGECCSGKRTTIHKSASGSIASHKGVRDGRNTLKGNGNGEAWIKSCNEEKKHNIKQNYTFRKRY
jgi:hypothetical protein